MQVRPSNLYYLLSYAWRRLIEKEFVDAAAEQSRSAAEFFARLLIKVTHPLLDRGLDKSYLEFVADLRRPRGKVSLTHSIARGTPPRGFLECQADDLSEDVVHNQILKATLRRLSTVAGIPQPQLDDLKQLVRRMQFVSDVSFSSQDVMRIRLHSNLRRYRPALSVCALLHASLIPTHESGRWKIRSFDGDEREMGRLFEEFVCGFLSLEQKVYPQVGSTRINWLVEGDDKGLIPGLQTDVTLKRAGHHVVLECKCYKNPLVSWGGGLSSTLRSEDVSQLASYLVNYAAKVDRLTGVLLYAVDRPTIHATKFRLLGHAVWVQELDLSRPWQDIDRDLRDLVRELGRSGGELMLPSLHQ